ncbi:MAG: HupE/UreJ family protein [Burkholderiaceae bacterium]
MPPGPVEAAIAASVVLAAAANLLQRRVFNAPMLAFAFGLIHGLGFASVMIESGAVSQSVALGLFGFNLGVELGQLAFVAAVLPLFVLLGRRAVLARRSGAAMSLLLIALGAYWFAERAADLGLA